MHSAASSVIRYLLNYGNRQEPKTVPENHLFSAWRLSSPLIMNGGDPYPALKFHMNGLLKQTPQHLLTKSVLLLLFVLMATWGVERHLNGFTADPYAEVLGDKGDGYFNYFVLEHVRSFLVGDQAALSNAGMFWPDHENTFWWSDNLLLPGILYTALHLVTEPPGMAAYLSAVFWTLAGMAAAWCLFGEVLKSVIAETASRRLGWQVLFIVLAYVMTFSIARMQALLHFQNLGVVCVIVQMVFAMRHLRWGRRRDLTGLAACETGLLFFSPYLALIGAVILSAWAFCFVANSDRNRRYLFFRDLMWSLPWALPAGWIFRNYSRADPLYYPLVEVVRRSARLGNYLRPHEGSFLSDALPQIYPGGYLGVGLISYALIMLGVCSWIYRLSLKAFLQQRVILIWAGVLALSCVDAREIYPLTVWLRLITLLAPPGALLWAIHRKKIPAARVPFGFLLLSGYLLFGVTLGPLMTFREQLFDPGIWGWYRQLLPGFGAMRDLLRFMPLVQLLLTCILFGVTLMLPRRKWIWTAGLVCISLQGWEARNARPDTSALTEDLQLSQPEQAFFSSLEGAMLVTPLDPFHRNARYLLMWRSVPDLYLVNGYSGRNTKTFSHLMRLERETGRASEPVLQEARRLGVSFLCLYRPHVEELAQLKALETLPLIFQNDRFLVFRL